MWTNPLETAYLFTLTKISLTEDFTFCTMSRRLTTIRKKTIQQIQTNMFQSNDFEAE